LEPGWNRRWATRQGLLPLLVLGGFAGMRTAEIQRQVWEDINLERGYIRVTGVKGNTAQKRLIPICDNLRAWLGVCRREAPTCSDYPRPFEAIQRLAARANVPWKHNALRHSSISYRVAQTGDVARVALESGNSPRMIFRHYRELVTKEEAQTWFSIMPKSAANIIPMPQAAMA
jgi:integrase